MGEERTEKATPKKRADARKKGQVRKSNEVNVAFCLLVMFALLRMAAPYMLQHSAEVFYHFFNVDYIMREINIGTIRTLFLDASYCFAIIVLPMMPTAVLAGVIINVVQVGFKFTGESMKFKMSAINPLSGLKRLFSSRGIMELLKSILKVVIIGVIVYNEYKNVLVAFPNLMFYNIADAVGLVFDTSMNIAFRAGTGLALLAAVDFGYQWWKYEKDLRMTKQEIKDEYKQAEGDPKVKGRIRQKQQQMAMMRMMSFVPHADVVITNPTHFAIALKYDESRSAAPMVVAKGKDNVALRIKDLAKEHHIHVVEDKPLARALYAFCEVGDEIPETLYQAVAEILAYAFKLRNGTRREVGELQ